MPRIYNCQHEPEDFCLRHFPTEAQARRAYDDGSEADDGRGNCFEHRGEHPPYDGEGYTCAICNKPLTTKDD
jgi:hypothetical protein